MRRRSRAAGYSPFAIHEPAAHDVSGGGCGSGHANIVSEDKAFATSRMAGNRRRGGGCVPAPRWPQAAFNSLA